MNISVRRIEKFTEWDMLSEGFHGSVFISRAWLECIANEVRKPFLLQFFHKNERIAVLGGIEAPLKTPGRKHLICYAGLFFKEQDTTLIYNCKTALHTYARENNYYRITLKSYDHHGYWFVPHKKFFTYHRMEYILDLSKGKENLIQNFDPDFRRRVRKAEREGAVFKQSYAAALVDSLFDLLDKTQQTRKAKGYDNYTYLFLPLFDKPEVEKLVKRKAARFFYVEYLSKIVCIQLIIAHQGKAYGILMGTDPMGYKLGAPSFIFQKGIEALCNEGFLYYNLGGVQPGKNHGGLKQFKDSLGAEIMQSVEETTHFIKYPFSLLNPALGLKRFLQHAKFIPWKIKKPIIRLADYLTDK